MRPIAGRSNTVQPLALTLGEPAGIGPDLALSVWHRRSELDVPPFYLVADPDFLKSRAELLRLDVPIATVTPRTAAAAFGSALPVVAIDVPATAAPRRPAPPPAPPLPPSGPVRPPPSSPTR